MTDPSPGLTAAIAERYRVERALGAGGMANVYLAHDLRHDRKVALKVLRAELAAAIGAERFLREIRTTANLQHPHILGLLDSGQTDGQLWYTMPFVDGESLRDRLIRETQLPVRDAIQIAQEVADALDYAHRHGIIHRDIKPENILLHDGRALVADFGIALAAGSGGPRMTETGLSLGTPQYMSPEQAMGEREITARSDVYALGCVLYEMLLGHPPFTGPSAQAIIAGVLTGEPRSLVQERRSVPPHVEAAVLQALEKLPADRFASAAEFAAALGDRSFRSTVIGAGVAARGWESGSGCHGPWRSAPSGSSCMTGSRQHPHLRSSGSASRPPRSRHGWTRTGPGWRSPRMARCWPTPAGIRPPGDGCSSDPWAGSIPCPSLALSTGRTRSSLLTGGGSVS
jgi:serine/threonine protein kinase